MAGIIAFLTRSPSVKGEQGSIRDMNAQSRLQYRKQQQQQQPPRRGGVPMKRSAPVKNRLDKKNKDQGMDDDDFDENAMDDKESFVSLVQTASGKKRNAVCPFHHTGPPAITTTASTPTPTTIPAAATPPKPKSTVSTATNKPTSLKMQVEMDVMLKQQQDHDDENRWYADKLYELGASHIDYDLLPHHLDLAAPALLSALRRRLNDECVPEVEEAWDHGMEAALSKQMRKDHRMSTMSSDSLEMDETRGQCMIQ
ncbi:hypothetical protein BC940DRAFT_318882 [Gongronella butleri]|nr:hypothetical protein BC940DRAFT_318882 [Gongronella butleri]